MADPQLRCKSCGARIEGTDDLFGQPRPCPKCGAELGAGVTDAAAGPGPDGTATDPGGGERFSERMKANRALAGRACAHCNSAVELGDHVFNCQECGAVMHLACQESAGHCGNQWCASNEAESPPSVEPAAPEAGPAHEMKECEFCGEKIRKGALRCRYCKEEVGHLRRRKALRKRREEEANANLGGGEIALGIFLGGIACIVSIVWIIQGKKKGWKLFLLSVVSQLIWGLLMNL